MACLSLLLIQHLHRVPLQSPMLLWNFSDFGLWDIHTLDTKMLMENDEMENSCTEIRGQGS